jgi:hypothetical protein
MSSRLKRGAKVVALGFVSSRGSSTPDTLSAAALRMMKIGLGHGMSSGYDAGAKAAACISVDFDVTRKERYQANHDGTKALLSLSENHGIPLTWAICGKTAVEDPEAYESILTSAVRQDVGVHTYSHIYADETSEAYYEQDIQRCISVLGLASPPRSFVFPKNREGHFGLLKRLGFTSFRGAKRVIGAPIEDKGLWNIRPVYYVDQKSLRASELIKRFVEACIARSAVFHLWTHPWSLAIDGSPDTMVTELLEPTFAFLEEKNMTGQISLTTMEGLSRFLSTSAYTGQAS